MTTRRRFIVGATTAIGSAYLLGNVSNPGVASARPTHSTRKPTPKIPIPGGTLDPLTIPKFVHPLLIPPAMPKTSSADPNIDYYEIGVRQFSEQILPSTLPATTVWGYGSVNHPTTFNAPSFSIEAIVNRPVRVKWINELVDPSGNFLPHLLTVDPTLHWANPPGGLMGRDTRPVFTTTPPPYTGPVPMVVHVHGAHAQQESDGYAETWFLPDAVNIPADYAINGAYFDRFKATSPLGSLWTENSSVFQYPNDQRATNLWFHDHTLGMTRLNVYAGPAGFYLLRGGPDDQVLNKTTGLPAVLPGPSPKEADAPGTKYYELPIGVQDRSFNSDGSLFYPTGREFFDGYTGPFIPNSEIAPYWNPEFFGNTMMVNGRVWPYQEVEQRRYRLRILNGCNSRTLMLQLSLPMPFWQIGNEGGFLAEPVKLDRLLLGPAERADVIVDFSQLAPGTKVSIWNIGPDSPFGGGLPGVDFEPSDPTTTGQVMEFRVVDIVGSDASTPPTELILPALSPIAPIGVNRLLSLLEHSMSGIYPAEAQLGIVNYGPNGPVGESRRWMDPITENPHVNVDEIWELHNFTEDAHPIHLHQIHFRVLDRRPIPGGSLPPGPARPPEAWETGWKETVLTLPGEITRIQVRFDIAGLYVWHCHIVEHEDNEMMRPFLVLANDIRLPLISKG